jgi:protein-S-isoprenylcysteine O-methyltransferase Ste14
MHTVALVILIVWAAFWIYWLAASVGVKTGQSRWGQFAGIRVGLVLVVLFLLRLGVLRGHATMNNGPWLEGIGLAVFLLGLALAVWARVYIGRNWGMPMTEKAEPELVTTGPYHTIRHPIYSGMILAMIGTTIAVSLYWLIAVALLGGYFIYSAVMEERYMVKRFPEAYSRYKRSSKMLIPFIF